MSESVTVSSLCAGFGLSVPTVGSVGAISSRSFTVIVNTSEYVHPFPSLV